MPTVGNSDRIIDLLEELVEKLESPTVNIDSVSVPPPKVTVQAPPAPKVNLSPNFTVTPDIHVAPPTVNVSPPSVNVEAPTVNISPPAVTVEAPVITVEQPPKSSVSWTFSVKRDQQGRIITMRAVPE
jgi:hypothetical protein